MRSNFHLIVLSFIALVFLLFTPVTTAHQITKTKDSKHAVHDIGAIVDTSSRIGQEEIVAMQIAKEDIYGHTNQTMVLHIKDSDPRQTVHAALGARDLIDTHRVEAILGTRAWEELSLVAEIGSQNQVPIFSFVDTTPTSVTERWPYLLQVSSNKYAQMRAIAAIVQSWNWHQVTIIYEDEASLASGVIPHLHDALREVDIEINQFLALPSFASPALLSQELENLKREQCRVFVVHLSLPLALHLFERAKKMKMMEKDYVWITTDPISSLVHSINSSVISSMQGMVGVKSYFPETGHRFQDFKRRFQKRFRRQNPEEDNNEPSIYAVQAYDAMWAIALAMNDSNKEGHELLGKIVHTEFQGLYRKVQFINQKVASADVFQIINVMGKSYREFGFWSNGMGFSDSLDENATFKSSMNNLGQVFWPGGPSYTPKGWTRQTSTKPLRIGVPAISGYKEYVNVEYDHLQNKTSFSGFAIHVFAAATEHLPFYLPYEFIAIDEVYYDNMVEQVRLKNLDAVVGDVAILSRRYQQAEFSIPYTETGLMLIAPARSSNKAWSFIKPFTKSMWILISFITIYNGFVIWLIERNSCSVLKGSVLNQIGIILWLSFNTLFSTHGGKLHSNLSRMSMAAWLFVALVIIQTYTANLASILTVQRLEPTVPNLETLINSNAKVGYCTGSYLGRYLVDVIGFQQHNIMGYGSIEGFAQAFKKKEISAVFLGTPLAKLLLARYCRNFIQVGQTFNVGGFAFVFPQGSRLLPSINEALLKVFENGTLVELENKLVALQPCQDKEEENPSLSPNGFQVLFIITGVTSTIALVIYIFRMCTSTLKRGTIWSLMFSVMKHWCFQKMFTRRVSNFESPRNSSQDAPNPLFRV